MQNEGKYNKKAGTEIKSNEMKWFEVVPDLRRSSDRDISWNWRVQKHMKKSYPAQFTMNERISCHPASVRADTVS
jgi:hypothetical protein